MKSLINILPLSLIAGFLAIGFLGCSDSDSSSTDLTNRLYVTAAESGTLTPTGNGDEFIITLNNVFPDVVWFNDRPQGDTGEDTTADFIGYLWPRVYGQVAPNAVIKFFVSGANAGLFVALNAREYDSNTETLTFQATLLNSTFDEKPGNLGFEIPVITILNNVSGQNGGSSFVIYGESASLALTGTQGQPTSAQLNVTATQGQYTLTQNDLDNEVLLANNAPGRYSNVSTTESFVEQWSSRFSDSPPNAVISGLTDSGELVGYFLTLSEPTYEEAANRITYPATFLDRETGPEFKINSATLIVDSADKGYYEMTVQNNFGAGEFYGATPTDEQIWLLSNFKFDYLQTSNSWVTGNATAGSWASVGLSDIDQGKIRIYRTNKGTRMYAILSDTPPTAAQPDPTTTQPNNYFEWSFDDAGIPGTLDLSWIDRFDFLTRLEVSNLPSSAPTMIYGAKQGQSTADVGAAMAGYTSQPEYAWLGTGASGFSQTLSFPGATDPTGTGWVTRNQYSTSTSTRGFASGIKSFTNALDLAIATAAVSPAWPGLTSGIGLNWTTAGFRVGLPQFMWDPATGTVRGTAWTAYVGFTKDASGAYTMQLTDFTLYKTPEGEGSGIVIWSAVNDADGAVYEVTQAEGLLDCIWISSWNNLVTTPAWVSHLGLGEGQNGQNVMYAIYNALASGIIHSDDFVEDAALPAWTGYVPRIVGVDTYNFEIFTTGAQVANTGQNQGLGGLLNGQNMITLLDDRQQADALVNPYMLELLRTQEVSPAYLYPSQDVWAFNGIAGASPVLGLQTGPLNGQKAFGDAATLDWYLGGSK
jgi:hypothetical protein